MKCTQSIYLGARVIPRPANRRSAPCAARKLAFSFRAAFRIALSIAVSAAVCGTALAEEDTRFPFILPWDDASQNVVNVGFLNPVPAGGGGYVRARDGHFFDEKGRRVRFIGVNMTAEGAFPNHADAEKIAARLHKFGVNIVRIHHADAGWSKINLFDSSKADTQHLNAEALDRLDYFVNQLKLHGVYTNLNLKVSRAFTAADGLPNTDALPYAGKPADYFMPRMIELQKAFARDLLTHVNPYTRMAYTDDPAVAVIELNNENSLVGAPWESLGAGADHLPAAYTAELQRQWNGWLKAKYQTTEGLRRSWSAADKPYGPNRLLNPDFSQGAESWNLELNTAPAAAKMSIPEETQAPKEAMSHVLQIDVTTLGTQNWHVQLHQTGVRLTIGEPYTVSFWAKADRERKITLNTSIDRDDYHNVGLNETVALTTRWQKYTMAFVAERPEKDHNRLSFILGDALGKVLLAGISLQPGSVMQFPPDARLEGDDWPLGRGAADPAGQDWIAFLIDTERRYVAQMQEHLRDTLKVHANITCSQAPWGGAAGLLRESTSDFVDNHAYWQHPDFPSKSWDPVDWRIPNTSMLTDAGGGVLPGLARYRLAGKPYTISEYSNPAPNDYQAETVPILAAFAAVQDWDGFYLFDYGVDRGANRIAGWFPVDANPAKMALLPAAACLFLRNDVGLAHEELRLRLPADSIVGYISRNRSDIAPAWQGAGVNGLDALTHRFSVSLASLKKSEGARTGERPAGEFVQTQEARSAIRWRPGGDKPVFTADSPYSKIAVGFCSGQVVTIGGWQAQVGAGGRGFAALTLTAMDARPIDRSQSLLLTAVNQVENRGMRWNADRTSVNDKWGEGPTVSEGVTAEISVHTIGQSGAVYALDGTGMRRETVPSKMVGGSLTFQADPKYKTLWYEIVVGAKR